MVAGQLLTVREAAIRAGRSEETIRRWIWSGRLPAMKRGTGYRVDVVHLEKVMVELGVGRGHSAGRSRDSADPAGLGLREWLREVDVWKGQVLPAPGPAASELLIEDRRGRR